MLEQKDLQAIAELIDARATKTEEKLNARIDVLDEKYEALNSKVDNLEERLNGRIDNLEERLNGRIDTLEDKIVEVERNLVSELVRTEDILTRRMDKIEKNQEELNQFYKVSKLEYGNVDLLIKIMEGFQKRLEALEKKNTWKVIQG